MELRSEDVAPLNRAGEIRPVVRHGSNIRQVGRFDVVRMSEIKAGRGPVACEQPSRGERADSVPTHVGDTQRSIIELRDPSPKKAQARQATLFAALEEELHSKTDSEKRASARCEGSKWLDEATFVNSGQGSIPGTHSREKKLVGTFDLLRPIDEPRLPPDLPDHVRDRGEIPDAIIDDCDDAHCSSLDMTGR